MTTGRTPAEIAALFGDIGAQLRASRGSTTVLEDLTALAVQRVDGADHAGVSIGRNGDAFRTVGATHELVLAADQIQYDLYSGPCVDAILDETTFNAADLRTDGRWPEFGRRCVEQTGIVSMLSIRLFVESDGELIAGLNMYSHQPDAFDEHSEAVAHLLATHGSLAVGQATAEEKSRNLMRALKNSREIGTAMGILMAQEKLSRDQAFDVLRVASQHTHRKLADIATELADTGVLPGRMRPDER